MLILTVLGFQPSRAAAGAAGQVASDVVRLVSQQGNDPRDCRAGTLSLRYCRQPAARLRRAIRAMAPAPCTRAGIAQRLKTASAISSTSYVTAGQEGLLVFNLRSPAAPSLVGRLRELPIRGSRHCRWTRSCIRYRPSRKAAHLRGFEPRHAGPGAHRRPSLREESDLRVLSTTHTCT